MTLQGQLAQSAHSAQSQTVLPVPDFLPTGVNRNTSLLGNVSLQLLTTSWEVADVMDTYRTLLRAAHPAFKLAILKKQKFTREGRQQRISMSLAALTAPQPTELSITKWKEILEEIEDED